MGTKALSLVLSLVLTTTVLGDIYMHNPRGSNNRLDEAGRERNNGNRMFDSQNNDRGGYNVGSLYYYTGSMLPIEWTNQHSCGGPNNHCELIVQYMCSENLRDGATTTTIPENPAQCENYNCNTDLRYGMHENFDYYQNCKKRQRNMGLFTADQKLKGNSAKYTRQNPQGTRRGYECPEERDHYPYWHPTPWIDLAIMTNDVSRCEFYLAESENVKGRYHCSIPYVVRMKNNNLQIPNNEEDCLEFRYPENNPNGTRAEWVLNDPHGVPAPKCQETEFSRDNHLGNGVGGYPNLFNWTIPASAVGEKCAMRIRYNISTAEFDGWDGSTNAALNEPTRGAGRNDGSLLDLSEKYGFENLDEAKDRGYVLENNPQVNIFDNDKLELQLAINTAQFGRTFQDRSHAMAIRQAPPELDGARVHNLNVRGKRGNIVQVYPAVEYDFVPNTLQTSVGDYVHMQWTGSNTNPKNNDGQGLAGTDRSNIVVQKERAYLEDSGTYWVGVNKSGHWGRSYPQKLDDVYMLGLTQNDLTKLALLAPGQFRGEMSELDDAGTYFDLGPRKITAGGTAHYMCSRNNNFSNRSQKGKIVASNIGKSEAQIGWTGGAMELPGEKAVLTVAQDVLPSLTYIQMEQWPSDVGNQLVLDAGQEMTAGNGYASDFILISPEKQIAMADRKFEVKMKLDEGASGNIKLYKTNSQHFSTWEEVDADIQDGTASFQASEGGVYVARSHVNAGAIAGGVIAALVIVVIVAATVFYFRSKPEKMDAINRRFRNAKRGTQSAI